MSEEYCKRKAAKLNATIFIKTRNMSNLLESIFWANYVRAKFILIFLQIVYYFPFL
jgi:hypothetical protein